MEETEQVQESPVTETQLPENYDVRFGYLGANDEIRNLIDQVTAYLLSQHSDELAKIREAHREELNVALLDNNTKAGLIGELEAEVQFERDRGDRNETDKLIAEENQRDSDSKRDAAVRAKEEAEAATEKALNEVKSLKSQVDELEGMLRTYRSQVNKGVTGGLVLTSTLKPINQEESKLEAEQRRIEQINRGLARIGSEPLPFPIKPAEEEVGPGPSEEPERFQEEDSESPINRVDEDNISLEVAGKELTLSLEGLNARLLELEEWRNNMDFVTDRLGI